MVFLKQEASVKINELESLILDLEERNLLSPNDKNYFQKTLTEVNHELSGLTYVKGWVTGGGPRDVWGRLHNVERRIDHHETDSAPVVDRAWINGKEDLPEERMARFGAELEKANSDRAKLELARTLTGEAFKEAATRHSSERNFQRNVFFGCFGLLLLAAFVLVIQTLVPSIHLLPPPDEGSPAGTLLVFLVMLCGSLGGFLGGFNKYLRQEKFENTRWYNVRPVLLFANVAVGLWTAFIGVLLVGLEMIVGKYQNLAAVLVLAVIFGVGQLTLTKYLDKKAADMLKLTT